MAAARRRLYDCVPPHPRRPRHHCLGSISGAISYYSLLIFSSITVASALPCWFALIFLSSFPRGYPTHRRRDWLASLAVCLSVCLSVCLLVAVYLTARYRFNCCRHKQQTTSGGSCLTPSIMK